MWPDVGIKNYPNSPKVAHKVDTAVFAFKMVFLNSPKVIKYSGYFCKKICCQELSKIAQSGHTVNVCQIF